MSQEAIQRGSWILRDAIDNLGNLPGTKTRELRSIVNDTIGYLKIQAARIECCGDDGKRGATE